MEDAKEVVASIAALRELGNTARRLKKAKALRKDYFERVKGGQNG